MIFSRGYYHEISQISGVGIDVIEPPLTTICAGIVTRTSAWWENFIEGSFAEYEYEEWCDLAGGRYEFLEELTLDFRMVLAVEVKAVHEDRIFFEVGTQIVFED